MSFYFLTVSISFLYIAIARLSWLATVGYIRNNRDGWIKPKFQTTRWMIIWSLTWPIWCTPFYIWFVGGALIRLIKYCIDAVKNNEPIK